MKSDSILIVWSQNVGYSHGSMYKRALDYLEAARSVDETEKPNNPTERVTMIDLLERL